MEPTSLEEFYRKMSHNPAALILEGISKEIGQLNFFKVDELMVKMKSNTFHALQPSHVL